MLTPFPGLYLAMTLNHSGGLLFLRWFRDTFGQEETAIFAELSREGVADGAVRDVYDLLLAEAALSLRRCCSCRTFGQRHSHLRYAVQGRSPGTHLLNNQGRSRQGSSRDSRLSCS